MSLLFSPLKIRNAVFKNRLTVSPMCMYSSVDGFANDFHLVHLGSKALGGFGLILQEATAISPEGRITDKDLGIWRDEHIDKLKQVVNFCHQQNALVGIQLAHAGRKASHLPPSEGAAQVSPNEKRGWETVSASAIAFTEGEIPPVALDKSGIQKIKDDFAAAVKRAKIIGYDVLEIHAAHGYLFHQFYSPLSNIRTDEYGGSFDNRIRLLLEITELVKTAWGAEKPLFVRISATDWVANGWQIQDAIALSKHLKMLGVDLIDTSSGGNILGAKIPHETDYQTNLSFAIKKETGMLTGAVGRIRTAEFAEELLEKGHADLILMARESLRHPQFPFFAARKLKADIDWPEQYLRAKRQLELLEGNPD